MVATRGQTFKRPWRRSCHSSKLKSSSAPIGRKDSWRFHAVGSSNAPLLGSTAAEGSQRIGRTSTATRWRSCGLPQSASCSENFVIPPDVFGQTLRVFWTSLSGDRGRTAAAAEGPWSCPPSLQGLSQSSPSRISQTDPAQAQYIWPSIVNFDDRDNAQATEYPRLGWRAYSPSNAAACADGLGMAASQPCPCVGSF